jgi:ppGpp synthetase/RelA/SpoT-type nucleotidyltranferase
MSANHMTLETEFEARRPALESLKDRVLTEIREEILPDPMVERMEGRVKSTAQFVKKAAKRNDDGSAKYPQPLKEIQDQVGIRIIVRFNGERDRIRGKVLKLYNRVEDRFKTPEEADRFGYEATHLVCLVPLDLKKELGAPIDFFEVQICTLFQHAWAEANHDVGYKAIGDLSREQERMIALAAANAWGADRIFQELKDWQDKHAATVTQSPLLKAP